MINGKGEVLQFGGQVMKNVAGYDISRLMAGSMGTLGVILDVSFKVLPRPAREMTLQFSCDQDKAIAHCNRLSGRPLPLSGACWHRGALWLRLSGAESEVERAARVLQAKETGADNAFWADLREHRLAFFAQPGELWRLSLPPATGVLDLEGDVEGLGGLVDPRVLFAIGPRGKDLPASVKAIGTVLAIAGLGVGGLLAHFVYGFGRS